MGVKVSILFRFLQRLLDEQGINGRNMDLVSAVKLLGFQTDDKAKAWEWVRAEWERREKPLSQKETLKFLKAGGKPKKSRPAKSKRQKSLYVPSGLFFSSKEWKSLRYEVLKEADGRCALCGSTAKNGVQIHVDHIKPRSKYPHLALAKSNLQVLCEPCNIGKSNTDETDWRAESKTPAKIT